MVIPLVGSWVDDMVRRSRHKREKLYHLGIEEDEYV